MKDQKSLKHVAFSLMILPVLFITASTFWKTELIHPDEAKYELSLNYSYPDSEPFFLSTFLPVNDDRQEVNLKSADTDYNESIFMDGENRRMVVTEVSGDGEIHLDFGVVVRDHKFAIETIDADEVAKNEEFKNYSRPTPGVQSNDLLLTHTTRVSTGGRTLTGALSNLFGFIKNFELDQETDYHDALTTLKRRSGSLLGKNRLFMAMCRSLKLPSRMVGGLILDKNGSRPHQWVEVYTADNWVPFDLKYSHFAALPMNYVSLFRGEEEMLKSSENIELAQAIEVSQIKAAPVNNRGFSMIQLAEDVNISKDMLMLLLLLPLGAFLVAIFKNVIGMKTYGMFVPVLLSMSFLQTGLLPGIVLFSLMIGAVVLVNYPLTMWGIQYNSKITAMLFAVVLISVVCIKLLHVTGWLKASAPLFFPMIILTFISERVAKKIEEEGARSAIELYGSTLLVTLFIYLIISSSLIQEMLLLYPELLITAAGVNLLLGKWIGLRLTEYYRFFEVIKTRS
ncbi:MAG: 7TM domain-containing protein [Bacteroidota bacterium]